MIKTVLNIIISLLICILFSCKDNNKNKQIIANPTIYKEPLIKTNKKLVRTEEDEINDYVNRYQWNMIKTGSGLRYIIYKKGNGEKAVKGKKATLKYKINLLNGYLCYDSNVDGLKIFEIGKGSVELGLEEAILLFKVGDKAKIIIPSHLAYGLAGDDNKIPKRATLVYDIELLDLK